MWPLPRSATARNGEPFSEFDRQVAAIMAAAYTRHLRHLRHLRHERDVRPKADA
jgi:hypothetical protein